jgi:hypothetical protein
VTAGLVPARRAGHPDRAPAPDRQEEEMVPRDRLCGHLADRCPASPTELAAIIRGHWTIEDRLHWVRDMDYDEDRSQVRTTNASRVVATLRNLTITILRLTGHASITAALRHHARRPDRPLRTIMNC